MTQQQAVAALAQLIAELAVDCETVIGTTERDRILRISEQIMRSSEEKPA